MSWISKTWKDWTGQTSAENAANAAAVSQREANKWSYRIALENRQWQDALTTSLVSRRAIDLQRAGINPILAAGQGGMGGAPMPSGSTATMQPEVTAETARMKSIEKDRAKRELAMMTSNMLLNSAAASEKKAHVREREANTALANSANAVKKEELAMFQMENELRRASQKGAVQKRKDVSGYQRTKVGRGMNLLTHQLRKIPVLGALFSASAASVPGLSTGGPSVKGYKRY